uniref:RNA-directed RNA polymerase n=1 Tax=Trichomonas vaginalis virus 1 TaxID=674953 RepID=F5B2U8_TTV1|nr:RNA-dependent RNA polymerase [Trichomonas vaginalis virus 1]
MEASANGLSHDENATRSQNVGPSTLPGSDKQGGEKHENSFNSFSNDFFFNFLRMSAQTHISDNPGVSFIGKDGTPYSSATIPSAVGRLTHNVVASAVQLNVTADNVLEVDYGFGQDVSRSTGTITIPIFDGEKYKETARALAAIFNKKGMAVDVTSQTVQETLKNSDLTIATVAAGYYTALAARHELTKQVSVAAHSIPFVTAISDTLAAAQDAQRSSHVISSCLRCPHCNNAQHDIGIGTNMWNNVSVESLSPQNMAVPNPNDISFFIPNKALPPPWWCAIWLLNAFIHSFVAPTHIHIFITPGETYHLAPFTDADIYEAIPIMLAMSKAARPVPESVESMLYAYGTQMIIQPHSLYTEGGLIRKMIFTVPHLPAHGYFVTNSEYSRYMNIAVPNDPRSAKDFIIGAGTGLLQIILAYQAAFSCAGPIALHWHANDAISQGMDTIAGTYLEGRYFTIPMAVAVATNVAQYTTLIRTDPQYRHTLERILPRIFGPSTDTVYNFIESAISSSWVSIDARRRNGRTRKFRTAFINRFHDPEFAYMFGITGNGIERMEGKVTSTISQEVDYLLNGGDLRNCPVLRTLKAAERDETITFMCKEKAGTLMAMDGTIRWFKRFETIDLTHLGWTSRGKVMKPYAFRAPIIQGITICNTAYTTTAIDIVTTVFGPLRQRVGSLLSKAVRCGPIIPTVKHHFNFKHVITTKRNDNEYIFIPGYGWVLQDDYLLNAVKMTGEGDLPPDQLPYDDDLLLSYAKILLYDYITHFPKHRYNNPKILTQETELQLFPLKDDSAARTKVNFYARLLWNEATSDKTAFKPGTYNDTVAGLLMWQQCALMWSVPQSIINRVISGVCDALTDRTSLALLKRISDWLKQLGLAYSPIHRLFIELPTLLGRGAIPGDAIHDIKHRLKFDPSITVDVPTDQLHRLIYRLLSRNLKVTTLDSFEDHLEERLLWSKSGSHYYPDDEVNKLLPHRPTRKEFLDIVTVDYIKRCKPQVFIRQSRKLEHGKERFIYNCDTISYVYFDYILKLFETGWQDSEAILSPGDYTNERLHAKISSYKYKAMLDYTDFNSQHTIESMRLIFETMKELLPSETAFALDWCIASFDNMRTSSGHKWVATLPSGHRATTFINTVLNWCYTQMVGLKFDSFMCAGDDVILMSQEPISLAPILTSHFKFNPSKQSTGTRGEFLRKHYTAEGVFAYPCRAIASLVSGNWLSETLRDNTPMVVPIQNGIDRLRSRAGLLGVPWSLGLSELIEREGIPKEVGMALLNSHAAGPGLITRDYSSFTVTPKPPTITSTLEYTATRYGVQDLSKHVPWKQLTTEESRKLGQQIKKMSHRHCSQAKITYKCIYEVFKPSGLPTVLSGVSQPSLSMVWWQAMLKEAMQNYSVKKIDAQMFASNACTSSVSGDAFLQATPKMAGVLMTSLIYSSS